MKQVLFLDDDHRRIDEIRVYAGELGFDLTVVETADECIAQLGRQTFDLVMLDHDLGGETYCDSAREDCGMEVVRWLKGNGGEHDAFMIHTMNEVAAATMYIELKALGYRVRQGGFGGEKFNRYLHELLEIKPSRSRKKKKSKSVGDRIAEYFRSLRLGK
jgi:CheY-like chemotaxis protein